MRIVTKENRIEGWCNIFEGKGEQMVIAFNRLQDTWIVGTSMVLPSNVWSAMIVQECMQAAFATLKEEIIWK